MPKLIRNTEDRIQSFRTSWRGVAPDAQFAGLTFTEFEAAVAPPLTVREEIAALEKALFNKKTEKLLLDVAANELLDLVVNSVRGTPGFGPDSVLYRALGYVRKSERKSGLTRKGIKPAAGTAAPVDADAA